jgi:uncharacterized protein (TIGR03437 family)
LSLGLVVSGATFLPGIVGGSWVSIFGQNPAMASRTWRSDEFLGEVLARTGYYRK